MNTPDETITSGWSAEIDATRAKLSERKTVHQWLNQIGVPDREITGKRMCLLRRLAVALGIAPHEPPTIK